MNFEHLRVAKSLEKYTVNVEYFTVFKFSRIGKTAKIKTAKIKTERKIEPSEKWNQANY